MNLPTPRWWYQRGAQPAPVIRALLRPASWLWTWTTARRIARADPLDPGVPVICVGNLTAGGAGKTPVVREVLRRLRETGIAAHGLSRGHGGSLLGPELVDLGLHTAREVGDEPLMLAADGPFWIARDRAEGALAAADAGARVIVMDDGHQNPSVKKALSLVVVDGETRGGEWPFGDGAVVPVGPMREPLAAGLARADAVVLMLPSDVEAPDPELICLFGALPVLVARLQPAAPPPPGPQLGFAGVGKPWKVERALKAAGAELVDFAPYADHAAYSENDLKFLASRAKVFGAGLITTEKDWTRLPPQWRERVVAWPVSAKFEDEAAFDAVLAPTVDAATDGGEGEARAARPPPPSP